MGSLDNTLGPILFQLPPRWRVNFDRLATFREWLPRNGLDFVFEFRDPSWYADGVLKLLSDRRVGLCVYDWPLCKAPQLVTRRIAYIRFHGPDKPYAGKYSVAQLRPWIEWIQIWREQVERVVVYFNNDQETFAIHNAQQMKSALENAA